ncbi:MAG: IS110 family transposase [Pyrinomonadaceae bacterium]
MTTTTIIGMGISKYSFELCGADDRGRHTLHRRLHRDKVSLFFANLPRCVVAMESGSGSQHWARKLTELGHQVMLIPAQHLVAFRQGAKHDRNDAAAIAEAAMRPHLQTVPVKTTDQQDLQTPHRVRERLSHHRTALISEIRGLLLEYGIVCAKGVTRFLIWLREEFETRLADFSPMAQETFHALRDEFRALDARLDALDHRIKAVFKSHPVCQQRATIPGVGALVATAIVASVCEPQRFKNGRQFAAYLGLVPRQHSTGGKPKLLGISKAGNRYLRMLLVHGARSIIYHHRAKENPRSKWVTKLVERRGFHKANIALANKNGRVVWKLLTTPGERFSPPLAA